MFQFAGCDDKGLFVALIRGEGWEESSVSVLIQLVAFGRNYSTLAMVHFFFVTGFLSTKTWAEESIGTYIVLATKEFISGH